MTRFPRGFRWLPWAGSCGLSLLLLSVNASGQELLWEVQEDLSVGVDAAQALILNKGGVVVVVGQADTPGAGFDLVFQSLGRANGKVKTAARVPISHNCSPLSSPCSTSTTSFITSLNETIYVVHSAVAPDDASHVEIYLAAYEGTSGVVSWMNYWDAGGEVPRGIAASAKAVVVVGSAGAVRAYHPLTGAILWEDRLDPHGTGPASVAIAGGRVLVAGTASTPSGNELVLRSYHAASGRLYWENRRLDTYSRELMIVDGCVFLAGKVERFSGSVPYLGAFEVMTGGLLWEDDVPLPSPLSAGFSHLAVKDNRIVAAGDLNVGGPTIQPFVRAYDRWSGQREWETGIDYSIPLQFFDAIALDSGALYAVGVNSDGRLFGWSEVIVRAYDAATGEVLWEDFSHRVGRFEGESRAWDVAFEKNRLFVAGTAGRDFLIRAFDIRRDGRPGHGSDDAPSPHH